MALGAGHRAVAAKEREERFVMVDGIGKPLHWLPRLGAVAILALGIESHHRMIGLRCLIVIGGMASLALEREAGVLPTDMAALTFRTTMGTCQSEIRCLMVEIRRAPGVHIVTHGTLTGEGAGDVIGESRARIVGFVTGPAIRWKTGKTAFMACGAGSGCVCTLQGKTGSRVVKVRGLPARRVMAQQTVFFELSSNVIGLANRTVLCLVTTKAVGGRSAISSSMTVLTLQRIVCRVAHETHGWMGKAIRPGGASRIVTENAVLVETRRDMIRLPHRFEFSLMTGVAFDRRVDEFLFLLLTMAVFAIRQCMRSEKREARHLMLRDRFIRRSPAGGRVAVTAAITEFSSMPILVAIRASGLHGSDGHAAVARGAARAGMIAPKRIAGFAMIEIDAGTQFLPRRGGMTMQAIHVEGPMPPHARTVAGSLCAYRRGTCHESEKKGNHEA